jgi:hypothetical protein
MLRGPGAEWPVRLSILPLDCVSDWTAAAIAASHAPVGYIDRVLSVYRDHRAGAWSSLPRGEQVAASIDACDALNAALGFTYDDAIQDEIARRSYEAFSAYERAGEPALARTHLARCLARKPAWLETYAPGIGARGPEIWSILQRRLEVCAHPWQFHVSRWLNGIRDRARWTLADLRRLSALRRAVKAGASCGVLVASSSTVVEKGVAPGLSSVTLEWLAIGARDVEVRVDGPAGPLLARGGQAGVATTGIWVHDGMVFVLRDVSAGHAGITLDVVRVRVRDASRRPARARAARVDLLSRARLMLARNAAQAAVS